MPFVTPQFQPNLSWMCNLEIDCRKCCLSHPAAIRREIGKRRCFGLHSKVPFLTDQFQPILQWVCIVGWECYIYCLSHPRALRGEVGKKRGFGLKSKVRFTLRGRNIFSFLSCLALKRVSQTSQLARSPHAP